MGGYVRKRKTVTLAFEGDPEFDGLEVQLRRLSTDEYLRVSALQELTQETAAAQEELLEIFADALLGWNLEAENEYGVPLPVPSTMDGIRSQDLELVLHIIGSWLQNLGGVPAPLESSSPDGGPSLEASMPMATLSLPHAS